MLARFSSTKAPPRIMTAFKRPPGESPKALDAPAAHPLQQADGDEGARE
jgi:hypothetical protein